MNEQKARLRKFFNGQHGALAGAMGAGVGMAIGTVLGTLLDDGGVWVWGFSLGFGGGMLVYALVSGLLNADTSNDEEVR